MLDDELVDAMKHGIVILCPDGRLRCFYPRIFTYSADYPEKWVSALLYDCIANCMLTLDVIFLFQQDIGGWSQE